MTFENPYYLYFIPVAVIGSFLLIRAIAQYKKKILHALGDASIISQLIEGVAHTRSYIGSILIPLALGLSMLALANPRMGFDKEVIKATSSDIYIAIDISSSMMARDIAPSRLERAKRFTQKLVDKLKGNRIGLIYFAGTSFTQVPLTGDYAAVKMAISTASPQMAGTQGTRIGDAIDRALKAYREGDNSQRALVIVTDGEDHDEQAIASAVRAKEEGMEVFTVGVGTEKGELIPEVVRGVERYKKDDQNKPVVSKLNIQLVKDLAKSGGGQAYLVDQGESAIEDIYNKIELLEKKTSEEESFSNYRSYYQYALGLGLLFFFIEWLWPIFKNRPI